MDHALREQPSHGLIERHEPQIAHDLGPEARVHKMQDRVLDSAHVQVDRKPIAHRDRIDWAVVLLWRDVAIEIPGRVDERVHGVGLAPRGTGAFGTSRLHEGRYLLERIATL